MTKVLILGASGMLGSMVARVLAQEPELALRTTVRTQRIESVEAKQLRFDLTRHLVGSLLERADCEWVINAIGTTKPRIDERDPSSVENALRVNALFPYRLAAEARKRNQKVIQIATDGVFSGARGPYDESCPHDAPDIYGKTKSLGEVPADNVVHLRCSIVGIDRSAPHSLLTWALSAPPGAELPGYTAQLWNGITTLQFARLCLAVIRGATVPSVQHVVPADAVTKADLLELILSVFRRYDVAVRREPGPPADRRLSTSTPQTNRTLWARAGYPSPPTVLYMLQELARYVSVSQPRRQ